MGFLWVHLLNMGFSYSRNPTLDVEECDVCGLEYESREQKYMHPYYHMGGAVYHLAQQHQSHILQPFRLHEYNNHACQSFNVPLLPDRPITAEMILYDLTRIMTLLGGSQFKIKLGASSILHQANTGKYIFFNCEHDAECIVAKAGERLAVYTHTIRSVEDMKVFASEMQETDLNQALERNRPDTSSSLVCATNLRYYVFKINFLAARDRAYELPAWVKKRATLKDIIYHMGLDIYNNLCLFRCIAYHLMAPEDRDINNTRAHENSFIMFNKYSNHRDVGWDHDIEPEIQGVANRKEARRYPGTPMADMKHIEKFFGLDIYVYQGTEDGKKVKLIYMPSTEGCRVRGTKPIHLVFLTPTELVPTEGQTVDMGLGHFVYITDITKFSKCYVCPGCTMTFKLQNSYYIHMRKNCTLKNNGRREVFPGKIYRAPEPLVEQIFRVGVKTKEEHLYHNMSITFDFECILKPLEGAQGTAKSSSV